MKRRLDFATMPFVTLVLILVGFTSAAPAQNQIIPIAILSFQDDTGANAAADLGPKLAQDLHQKVATTYKDLLPRIINGTDAGAVKGLTIDQIAAAGKQNGAKFVVRGGLLSLISEPAGSDSKVTVQLYADIISADTSALVITLRAEGSAAQSGMAPPLSSLDVKNDQFSSSGVGQALAVAIAQLADSIHQAIAAGKGTGSTTTDTTQVTQTQSDPAQAAAALNVAADTDLQQLITQAEALLSNSTNPNGQSATTASQALQALKSALEAKATLMQNGQDTSQADQNVASQRQALQAAVTQMTTEAAAVSSSGSAPAIAPQQTTDQQKSFMQKINDFAGQALSLLQSIQQMRTTLQSVTESSTSGSSAGQTTTNGATSPTEQQLGEVNGSVTDQNGAPIQNAQVAEQTSGISTSTDNNGQYDLRGLLANQIAMLTVTANGKTMTAQTTIAVGQPATVDFQLKPDATSGTHPIVLPPTVILNPPAGTKIGALKGVVRDAQGRPLARALVTLKGLGAARTDSLGRYQFLNVPAGSQQLSVNQTGLQPRTAQVRVAAATSTDVPVQFAANDRIALPTRPSLLASTSGATLSGSVRDAAGNPVAGAKISLMQQASAVAVFTGSTGTFVLNNIKAGPYRAVASKAGYETSLQNLTLSSGVRASVQFRLNEQNSPVVANVLKSRQGRVLDGNGMLDRRAMIRGRVLDANGKPIIGASVVLRPIAGNVTLSSINTNRNGEYQFSAEPGKYEVRASASSYQPASHFLEAQAGATAQTDFALARAATDNSGNSNNNRTTTNERFATSGNLVGRITDAKTGRPIGGAKVTLSPQQGTQTNQTGNFEFANLSAGKYQLTISRAGYSPVQISVSIEAGKTVSANLTLTPQSTPPIGIRRP